MEDKRLNKILESLPPAYVYIRHNPRRYYFSLQEMPGEQALAIFEEYGAAGLREEFAADLRPDGWLTEFEDLKGFMEFAFRYNVNTRSDLQQDLGKTFANSNIVLPGNAPAPKPGFLARLFSRLKRTLR